MPTPPRHSNDTPGHGSVTMLVVRPHPDDETSLTGGMLAYYSARGVRTGVVTCTGGEEGESHDPDLNPIADLPRLVEIRERELRAACAASRFAPSQVPPSAQQCRDALSAAEQLLGGRLA